MTECSGCGKSLQNGLDTFGDVHAPMCWKCYAEMNTEDNQESWYGLGPHEHTYDEQGNIILGGTKFLPLPEKNENGEYDFGDRTFIEDPEAPGCGIWTMKPLPGWK